MAVKNITDLHVLGNVGIGTTIPTSQLTLSDPISPTLEFNRQGSTANGWIKTTDNSQNVEAAIQMYGNEMRFYTSSESSQRMVINAAGNVGIGTTSPGHKLHVVGTTYTSDDLLVGIGNAISWHRVSIHTGGFIAQSGNKGIGVYADGTDSNNNLFAYDYDSSSFKPLKINASTLNITNGTSSVIYHDGTNVGIGTTSPASKLTLYSETHTDDIRMLASNGGTTNSYLGNFAGGTYLATNYYYNGSQNSDDATKDSMEIYLGQDNFQLNHMAAGAAGARTSRISVISSGNVGIGAANPAYKLDVNGGIQLNGKSALTNNAYFVGAPSFGFRWNNSADTFNNVIMYDNGNMYVRGNVGIGTTNPNTKLHIVEPSSTSPVLSIQNSNANGYSGSWLYDSAGTLVGHFGWANGTTTTLSNKMYFGTIANKDVVFTTNDTEKVRITATGNVGIGTTSPILNGVLTVVQQNSAGLGSTDLTLNHYYAGTKYIDFGWYDSSIGNISNDGGTRISINSSNGLLLNPSSGNVGIGTTSPFGRLNVSRAGINEGAISFDDEANNAHLVLAGTDASVRMQLGTYNNGSYGAWIQASYDNGGVNYGVEPLILNPQGGNVGIGTTSPSRKLTIESASTTWDTAPSIAFYDNVAVASARNWVVGNVATDYGSFNIASSIAQGGTPTTPRLTINRDGYVGIGTTGPSEKLNVDGNILATGTILGSNLSGTNTGDQVLPTDFVSAANGGTFSGDIFATNLSGTNTGDQDLSGYLLNTTDTFTGKLTISSTGDEMLVLQDNDSTGVSSSAWISFKDSAGTRQGYVGMGSGGNSVLYLEGIGGIRANNPLAVAGAISATGNITGANLSGTNTGDQDLSGYALTSHLHDNTTLDMHFGRETQNIDTYDPDSFWATSRGTGGLGTYPGNYYNIYNFAGNGSSEGTQLATYYGGNNKTYIRSRNDNGNVWLSWEQVWTSGTDGANSGLDADLLDGQHASAFQPAGSYLTTTGKAADSDLLDGIDSTSFLRSDADDSFGGNLTSASSGWIKFYHPTETDSNDGKIGAGVFDSGLNIVGAQTTAGTGRQVRVWGSLITSTGNSYWHGGNDGADSGLDADLLDGQHASDFATTTHNHDSRYLRKDTSDAMAGVLTLNSGGANTYGRIRGYENDNHFITIRGGVQTGTDTLNITAGHQTTFVEHADSSSEGWYFVSKASGNYTELGRLDGLGNMFTTGSHRSPFFYDTDDTNYYLDPDGGSSLNDLTVSGILQVGTDVRSRVYYDLDDAAYYGDFASTSNLNAIKANSLYLDRAESASRGISWYSSSYNAWSEYMSPAGTINCGATANITAPSGSIVTSWAQRTFIENASNYGWTWESGGANGQPSVVAEIRSSDGLAQFNGGVRSPIFYDSDDTDFYVDPNSTSRFNKIQTSSSGATPRYDTAFYVVQGQHWYGDTDSQIMYLGESGNDVLLRGQMSIGGTSITAGYALTMGGSINANNTSVNHVDQLHFNDNVRFYDDGDDSYLNFKYGDATTGGIRFRNGGDTIKGYLYASDGGFGLLDNDGNWAVRTQTGTDPLILHCDGNIEFYVHTSYTYSPGSSRAPIFYDSNDTGYYLDPAGTSNLSALNVINTINARTRSLAITGFGDAEFTFYQGSGTFEGFSGWHNYLISNHGNGSNYYNTMIAMPFWGPPKYSRREGNVYRGPYDFWTSERDINSAYNISAPIFYDYDNTSFYLDPTSTSRINDLKVTGAYYDSTNSPGTSGQILSSTATGTDWIDGIGTSGFTMNNGAQIKTYQSANSGSSQSAATLITENDITIGGGINWWSEVQNGSFGTYNHAVFYHGSSQAGAIRRSGNTTVSYTTSSDYRLKENVVEITDGIERVKQLKPSKFNFIGEDRIVDGFLAHEVQGVVPESISGEKDEVDNDGNPVYQGIDQSKIVPLLAGALKEAISKIEQLETRIQTLENKH